MKYFLTKFQGTKHTCLIKMQLPHLKIFINSVKYFDYTNIISIRTALARLLYYINVTPLKQIIQRLNGCSVNDWLCEKYSFFVLFCLFFYGVGVSFFHCYWEKGVDQKRERQYLTLSSLSSWITCVPPKRSGLFSPYQTIFK